MAKSHKTKKHLKEEKSKTKLKGRDPNKTKFLPKGANVTDVNFKIKQIVILEQLKAHGADEVVSKRKLNIKDLLSRLKHYNTNIKSDALQDLIEVFSSYKEEPVSLVIQSYISQILQNTCHLLLDKEKSVRQKAVKLISLILSTVEKEKIFPFSNIILSYLKCAMTDINKSIQGDSLLLLDSLVADFPQAVTEYSQQILPIFFILISNVQSNTSGTKTLQLNLQGTSTSTKWRLQVLNRLQKILTVIVTKKIEKNKTGNNDVKAKKKIFYGSNDQYIPIYNTAWLNYPLTSSTTTAYNKENDDNNENGMVGYINSLVPLLYDTWLEVLPENMGPNKDNAEGTVLTQEAASIFKSILTIFYLLWQLVHHESKRSAQEMYNLFSNKVGKKFLNRILGQYPFTQSGIVTNAQKKELKDILELNEDKKCVDINLLVCYLYCVVNKKIHSNQQKADAEKVLEYLITKAFRFTSGNNVNYLITVVRIVLINNSNFWSQKQLNVVGVLDGLISFCENSSLTEEDRARVMEILCEIPHNTNLNSSQKFQKWLNKVPSYLAKNETSTSVIDTVLLLSKQNNVLIQDGLTKYLPDILDNILSINVENVYEKMRLLKILGCLFYVKCFKETDKKTFSNFVEKNANTPVGKIVKDVLVFCY